MLSLLACSINCIDDVVRAHTPAACVLHTDSAPCLGYSASVGGALGHHIPRPPTPSLPQSPPPTTPPVECRAGWRLTPPYAIGASLG